MTRRWLQLCYVLLLIALVAGSTPRQVGDGGEYVEMASQIAALHAPAVHAHFWLYSALAAPFVAVVGALGEPAVFAFPLLNLLLLVGAFTVVVSRFDRAMAFVLFSGPIVWWVDKPHTEPLTFALLSVAVVLLDEAPWWSLVALGAAAAQNLAIAPLVWLAAVVAVWQRPSLLRAPRLWIAMAIACGAIGVNLGYFRFVAGGVPILVSTLGTVPNVDEVGAVLWDLNIGLVPAFPVLGLLVVAGLARLVRRPAAGLRNGSIVFAAIGAIVLLGAFSQTVNYNHGGTFGMSRYGLWLVPLSMPFLALLVAPPAEPRRWPAAVAVASCVWSAFAFHPNRPEAGYMAPSQLAAFMWTRYPSANNPIPEVFVERLGRSERDWLVPVRTARCEKILLTGRPDFSMWPLPCPPTPVPASCAQPGRLCYANFDGRGYGFRAVPTPSTWRFKFDRLGTWPISTERVVGDTLRALRWWQLAPIGTGNEQGLVVATHELRRLAGWHGADRLFLYLEPRESESGTPLPASVTLRVPVRMSGRLIDAESGALLAPVTVDAQVPAEIAVPAGRRYAALVLLAPPA